MWRRLAAAVVPRRNRRRRWKQQQKLRPLRFKSISNALPVSMSNNRGLARPTCSVATANSRRSRRSGLCLRKRLGETVSQLSESTSSLEQAESRAKVMEASEQNAVVVPRSPRTIACKTRSKRSRFRASLCVLKMVAYESSCQPIVLFLPKSATLHRDAFPLIDQVAAAVKQAYPRQTISVEGHTDSDQVNGQFSWRASARDRPSDGCLRADGRLRHRFSCFNG